MKKFVSIIMLAIVSIAFTSCTDLTEDLEQENEKQTTAKVVDFIDPEKDCPQNDRNCNGVPDNQE